LRDETDDTLLTFSELTKLLLHFCHRVPVPLRVLLRRVISICAVVLLLRHGRVCTLRIGKLATLLLLLLLLLLLPTRDLVAGILLLVLEQELTRELLV